MVTGSQVAVGVAALVIVVATLGGTAAITADRTVLDESHVTETAQDEGLFGELSADIAEDADRELDDETPTGITVDSDWLEDGLDEQQLADEFERNLGALFAFLRGDTDSLELSVDMEPIADDLDVTSEHVTVDTAALADEIEVDSDDYDVEVDGEMLTRQRSSQSEYDAVRQQLRDDVREQITAESPLFDDPDDVPEEVVDEAMDEFSEELRSEAESNARAGLGDDADETTVDAAVQHQFVVIDGLTDRTYDDQATYAEELSAAETELEAALADEITREFQAALTEEGDQLTFGEELEEDLDDDELSTIETALNGINIATWALPLFVVVLVAGILYLTGSLQSTAMVTGIALGIAGLVGTIAGFVGGSIATAEVETLLADTEEIPAAGADTAVALVDSVFSTLVVYALPVAVLGIVLVGVAYADRAGYVDLDALFPLTDADEGADDVTDVAEASDAEDGANVDDGPEVDDAEDSDAANDVGGMADADDVEDAENGDDVDKAAG